MLDKSRRDEALRHFQRGLALERANRPDKAVESYRLAIDAYENFREAHNALGFYYQRNGLLAKAVEEFHIVATLEGDFLAYFNLGYVLVELERFEEALNAFQQCLNLQPNDSATHLEIGYIHFSRGNFDQALDHLQHPLRTYPEDWIVHNLIGKCYLGMRQFEEAMGSFGQAFMVAHTPDAQAELFDNITTVQRHREFRQLNTVKDHLYAHDGVVYLGSAQDDGLHVAEVQDYHFTYPDVGTTLQRLIALYQSSRWDFSAIVSVDSLSRPVAETLSRLLQIPLRPVDDLTPNDRALLVVGVAHESEILTLTIERIACSMTAFCLGLNWTRHSRLLPDLIGIVAHGACSVPWESELRRLRSDGAPAEQINRCISEATAQIVAAVRDTPVDTNLPRQIRYYTRTHRRVNVAPAAESQS